MTIKRAALAALAVAHIAIVPPAWGAEKDPVAATVNGHEILLSDVEEAKGLLPPQLQAQPLEVVYDILLNSLINSRLAADKARALGLDGQAEYKRRMARIGDQILERMLLTQHIERRITEETLLERYDRHKANLEGQREIQVRHILVKAEDVATALIEKLDEGDDFADLAREFSVGPSAADGGELGWIGAGQTVPPFETAAMALKPGTYTDKPVETRFGWHVIEVQDERPVEIPEFESMRPALVNELSAEMGRKLMTDLRDDANIETKAWQDIGPAAKTE